MARGPCACLGRSPVPIRDRTAILDLLVEMDDRRSLFEQAALQGELEDLLACRVHVLTTGGLRYAREQVREQIQREAVLL
jgi:predicted nucleotidyltransferase